MKLKLDHNNPNKAHQIMPGRCKKSATITEAKAWILKDYEILEEKMDGRRYLLQIRPNGAKINYLTSRHISKETGLYVQKQDDFPWIRDFKFPVHMWGAVLDGELFVEGGTSADAQRVENREKSVYVYWDILRATSVTQNSPFSSSRELLDVSMESLSERLNYFSPALVKTFPKWMRRVNSFPTWSDNPRESIKFIDGIMREGGEGVVKKDLRKPYGEGWTKVKAVHTDDVVIWGYEETKSKIWASKGWIGALLIGQWQLSGSAIWGKRCFDAKSVERPKPGDECSIGGKAHKFIDFGACSGITNELRDQISKNKSDFLGQAIEIKAHLRYENGMFRSPRFLRLRDDKNHWQCIYEPKSGK